MTVHEPISDPSDLVTQFRRDGFVNGGRILDDEEVAELQRELDTYVEGMFLKPDVELPRRPMYGANIGRVEGESHYQLCGMWEVSLPFRRLIENERLIKLAATLMDATVVQVWSDTVQYKPARTGAHFQWHQDAPYHISIDPATKLLGAWVALDDADVESGCMWMVPGSHLWGEQERHLWSYARARELEAFRSIGAPPDAPGIAERFPGAVPRPVRAGEVHFHHALTWHGSPVNRSPRPRRAYTIHFMPEGMRVSTREDVRVPYPAGRLMTETGPEFPIVYRKNG
jgi:phytanoyl-CoA hydroxylase